MRIPRRWMLLPLILYWVGICVATHLPAARIPHVQVCDKTAHFFGFFFLAGLLANEFSFRSKGGNGDWLVLLVVALYAAADEWTQQYVGRQTDVHDWFADMAGAGCGLILWGLARAVKHYVASHWRRRRGSNHTAIAGSNVDRKLESPASAGGS